MRSKLSWKPVLLPMGLCIKDDNIWFLQLGGNQLIKVDIHSFRIIDKFYIPWEKGFFHRDFNDQILDVGDKLFVLLNGSNSIYAYDIETGKIEKQTSFPEERKFWNNSVICRNEYLYILPYENNELLKYDFENDCWEKIVIGNSIRRMEKCFEEEEDVIISVDSGTNKVTRYYLLENRIEEVAVGEDNCRYWGIKRSGDFFVLLHKKQRVITLWNEKTGEIYDLTGFPQKYAETEEWAYLNMYRTKNDILIFPYCANMVLRVDVDNKKIDQVFSDVFFEDAHIDGLNYFPKEAYSDSIEYQRKVYLYAGLEQCWHVFDIEKMTMKRYQSCEFEKEEDRKYIGRLFDDESSNFFMASESRATGCNFNNFILSLDSTLENRSMDLAKDRGDKIGAYQIGKNIWENVKN